MAIGVIFNYGTEILEVLIKDSNVFFRTSQFQQFATIDGIKLDKSGVIKEFPDLKDNKDWKNEAISRFKEKIKKMENEEERIKYIINDLNKFGYKAMYLQKSGHRRKRL